MNNSLKSTLQAVLFDYGGVIADEGFYQGLVAIGRKAGLDPGAFFRTVDALIYETGYLIGKAGEAFFWDAVRKKTGISGSDEAFRHEILSRFSLRPDMVAVVDELRAKGLLVALLSDQTDWLEELDERTGLYRHFDRVFNSYRTHKSKRDASLFREVCAALGKKPHEALFIDDNIGHIERARQEGLNTIHFIGSDDFLGRIGAYGL